MDVLLIVLRFLILVSFSYALSSNFSHTSPLLPELQLRPRGIGHSCGIRNATNDANRRLRIVIPVNTAYFGLLFNWLKYFHELCPSSERGLLYFVCMDKAIEEEMKRYGLFCSHVGGHKVVAKMWADKTQQTNLLLNQGYDVLLCDLDAIWLRNPFQMIERFSSSDIIGSTDLAPTDFGRILGATFSVGFLYIKSTPSSIRLYDEVAHVTGSDDQWVFNMVVKRHGLLFSPKPRFGDDSDSPHTTSIFLDDENTKRNVTMTLLSHREFRRVCKDVDQARIQNSTVVHCQAELRVNKEETAKIYRVWKLRTDWKEISFLSVNESLEVYMDMIDERNAGHFPDERENENEYENENENDSESNESDGSEFLWSIEYQNISVIDNITNITTYVSTPRCRWTGNSTNITDISNCSVRVSKNLRVKRHGHSCGIYDAKRGANRPVRIVISSTASYIAVIFNWLIYFHRHCPQEARELIFFICLDDSTRDVMRSHGLRCDLVTHGITHSKLWGMRVQQTKKLLDEGFDVLLSDADAIWLRNPFEVLEGFDTADVLGSRASFPFEISRKLGATFCMGFMYIKSTPAAKALWAELAVAIGRMHYQDDQRAFNAVLNDHHVAYPAKPRYPDDNDPSHVGTLYLKNKMLVTVTLLSHKEFRRICRGVSVKTVLKSVVAHCLTEKKGNVKEDGEKKFDLWTIRDNWKSYPFDVNKDNIDGFLDRIDAKKMRRLMALENSSSLYDNS